MRHIKVKCKVCVCLGNIFERLLTAIYGEELEEGWKE